jgi:hypothetical protein
MMYVSWIAISSDGQTRPLDAIVTIVSESQRKRVTLVGDGVNCGAAGAPRISYLEKTE